MSKTTILFFFTWMSVFAIKGQTAEVLLNHAKGDSFNAHYDSAMVKINKAILLEPNLARGYYQRANFIFNMKKVYDIANTERTELKRLQSYRTSEKVLKEVGLDSIYSKALADYSKAIKLDNNYWEAYRDRAELYELLGQKKEALADNRKFLELAPIFKSEIERKIKRLERQ